MSENRTSKVFSTSFKSKNSKGGYVASSINLSSYQFRRNISNEGHIRNQIQRSIRDMITERKNIEEIKQYLNKEQYNQYEQYFDEWIQNWILKLNPDIKSVIIKGVNRNIQEQEMISVIEQINPETYELYKNQIINKIRTEIQSKEIAKKREELKKQEEER